MHITHNIHEIILELNESNSSNYKMDVLRKHKDNILLQNILKMTYDSVAFTYGISLKNISYKEEYPTNTLHGAISLLYDLSNRKFTGNAARDKLQDMLSSLHLEDAIFVKQIINRDLRINIGKTQINKVFTGLITKPTYMRCGVYNEKTSASINFPAILQLKADGTYREFHVQNNYVTSRSRSGESYEYPVLFHIMSYYPDGVYVGELTVQGIADRAEGNGLINSDEPPHNNIILELWDYITLDEYELAAKKDRKNPCVNAYDVRFNALRAIVSANEGDNVKLIPTNIVDTLQEALQKTSEYMSDGFEGAILKDTKGVFRDGTSKYQLKLKIEIDAEFRITGFQDGRKDTKREGKIGSIIFENDEGTIKGKCSGFTDKELDFFTANQDELLNKIITVQFNDLSKARGNDYYALSHPRFIEIRNDKDETDTLSKVLELRDMAIELTN